jgi:hypothetical protein
VAPEAPPATVVDVAPHAEPSTAMARVKTSVVIRMRNAVEAFRETTRR